MSTDQESGRREELATQSGRSARVCFQDFKIGVRHPGIVQVKRSCPSVLALRKIEHQSFLMPLREVTTRRRSLLGFASKLGMGARMGGEKDAGTCGDIDRGILDLRLKRENSNCFDRTGGGGEKHAFSGCPTGSE